MRQQLLDLYEIQKIDLTIRDQERQRDAIPQALTVHQGSLAALHRQKAALQAERAGQEQEARTLQTTLEIDKDKVRKWESRLTELRNQREYQALYRETEGQKRSNRDYEEKLHALYKSQESLDEQLAELDGRMATLQTTCDAENAEVNGRLQALEATLQEQRARRDALVPGIPAELYRKYDTIRARRLGVGLSVVTEGSCNACNMRLPPQLYNVLQRGDSIQPCPSCSRVMLWDTLLMGTPHEMPGQAEHAAAKVAALEAANAKTARKASSKAKKASTGVKTRKSASKQAAHP